MVRNMVYVGRVKLISYVSRILYNLFARTAEEGAKNLVWGSIEDNIPPGAYVASCALTE